MAKRFSLLDGYFLLCGFLSGVSVPLYFCLPAREFWQSLCNIFLTFGKVSIVNFNGVTSPTAEFWVRVVGSGDVLCAFICFYGFFSKSAEVRTFSVRCIGLYNFVHVGMFTLGSYLGQNLTQSVGLIEKQINSEIVQTNFNFFIQSKT